MEALRRPQGRAHHRAAASTGSGTRSRAGALSVAMPKTPARPVQPVPRYLLTRREAAGAQPLRALRATGAQGRALRPAGAPPRWRARARGAAARALPRRGAGSAPPGVRTPLRVAASPGGAARRAQRRRRGVSAGMRSAWAKRRAARLISMASATRCDGVAARWRAIASVSFQVSPRCEGSGASGLATGGVIAVRRDATGARGGSADADGDAEGLRRLGRPPPEPILAEPELRLT